LEQKGTKLCGVGAANTSLDMHVIIKTQPN